MSKRDWMRAVAGRVLYILLGAALTIWLLIFSGPLGAATFRGDEASCEHLATFGARVAMMREEGVPWDVFAGQLNVSLEIARTNPDSYVKDQDDVDFVMKWFKTVYDNPAMQPEVAYTNIKTECMRTGARWSV